MSVAEIRQPLRPRQQGHPAGGGDSGGALIRSVGLVALVLQMSLPAVVHGQALDDGRTKLHVGDLETSKGWFGYDAIQHLGIENLTGQPIASVVIECGFSSEHGYTDGNGGIFGPIAARQTLWAKVGGSSLNRIVQADCGIPEGGVR
ncbi:hypothetical protein OIU35_15950 [Boseaceae bacterium BT-24-1]|nr:hypothetical protein [Boseaceae bacterium BT-24-1]